MVLANRSINQSKIVKGGLNNKKLPQGPHRVKT